ncbi:MAG: sulfatase [Halosimplex sp.]
MTGLPNVVWVTIESTRADHTSVDGYERDTTPNLRRIADSADGRSFDACFAHGVWTLPSSASILTGTVPTRHDAGMESEAIPERMRTVPELFRELGYRTAGLSTNFHASGATDLDRGFDRFGWLSRDTLFDVVGARTLAKYLAGIRRHSAGFTTDTSKHSTGYLVTDVLKRWLRDLSDDQPFFLYAHYGDPHHEYYPPLPYHDRFLDDIPVDRAREIVADHHDRINELIATGCELDEEAWTALKAMYDAEIAYTDELIGELFDRVRERWPDTVFVITADHGELFGEQGMLAHKVVTDDAVSRVPLVVHGLPALTEHSGELVQHVDVVRTLLADLGHRSTQLQGYDLREETRPFAVTQRGAKRYRKNVDAFTEIEPAFDADRYHDGQLHALRTESFKYLSSDDGDALVRPPDEETDVSGKYPDVAERLRERLETWLETTGRPFTTDRREREYSGAVKRQMEDLGYLE